MTSNPPAFTLGDIESRSKNYRSARDLLGDRVRQLQDQMDAARRAAEPLIRSALQAAKAAEAELVSGIAASPALFKRPKTLVFHGVRVGFLKGKGRVVMADEAKTISLIRKHFDPDQADLLIRVRESVAKAALGEIATADLKRIGVEITDAGEQVLVQPVDSELDRMLAVLLKAEAVEAQQDE
ncbi:MAG: hypothetical protein ACT4PG_09920 [Panacagrimonas sp.]